MTLPVFITRSYGGGAVPAQLSSSIGSTDTSFTIVPQAPATDLASWVQENGSPLGTAGPFTVIIDRFTTSVEKIECSTINLTTGLANVTVSGGNTGRGYDGTDAQPHYPGGSQSGVQTTWSAQEALEANAVAFQILGAATVGNTDMVYTPAGLNEVELATILGPLSQSAVGYTTGYVATIVAPGAVGWAATPSNNVIGVSGAFAGTPPTASAVKLQVGYVTGTAASGLLVVTFAEAFSSSLVGVSLSQISGPVAASIGWESGTTTGFTYTVNGAGSPYSGAVAFSYLAYGS